MDNDDIISIKSSRVNKKIAHTHPFNPVFSMLLAETSPEIFPKHKRCLFISESFALN